MTDDAATRSHISLFVGKGGVGKTTIAAAVAIARARAGRSVLLASIDGTHDVSTVLAVPRSTAGQPSAIRSIRSPDSVCGIDMVEIDTLGLLENRYRSFSTLTAMAGTHTHGSGIGMLDPEELTGVPGAQDLIGLHEILLLARGGRWDDVIVDCPPSADWLRIAAVPELVCSYLGRIWPEHSRVRAGVGSDPRLRVVAAVVDRVESTATSVSAMLTDTARTTAAVVASPDAVTLRHTRDLLAANALLGIRTERVIVDKVVPQLGDAPVSVLGVHPAVFWFEAVRGEQREAMARFARDVTPLWIGTATATAYEPVGWASLEPIGREIDSAERAPGTESFPTAEPRVSLESGSGVDSVYVMTVNLPLIDADTVRVGRVEDDVIVGGGLVRRRFRLASVLRRCTVVDARFADGTLTIRFTPDPALWPS